MARMTMHTLWIWPLLFGAAALTAQQAPLVTDRPDFTESSTLVPYRAVQLEAGLTSVQANRSSGAGRSTTWPELLVRYGLASRVELRVAQSLVSSSPPAGFGTSSTGASDLYVGVKLGLGAQHGARPELAALIQATLPTGAEAFTENSTLPGAALLAGWTFTPAWSLSLGLQANRITGDGWEIAPSASVGRSLTSRLKAYGEFYSLIPALGESGARAQYYVNGGLALLLSDLVQADARIGAGLGGIADRSFVGFGVAVRL